MERDKDDRLQASEPLNDEVDLIEIVAIVWAAKIKIIAITLVFGVLSVLFVLSIPNMYKSEIILAPAKNSSKGGGLASQYGGLAAIAGINLGGIEANKIEQAVKLLKSWSFLDKIVKRYKLAPKVLAIKGWDGEKNQVIYDSDIYNIDTKQWVQVELGGREPTSFEIYKALSKMITAKLNSKSGMLTITVEHYSPQIAYDWTILFTRVLNEHYQHEESKNAQKSIAFLRRKIEETAITAMDSMFYDLIESQTQTLMLAEVSDEYLVKTVVSAMVPEQKSKPRRAFIVVLCIVLGGMLSTSIVLVRYFILKSKLQSNVV